jgi:4-diphosphocytidyl-2-C-methyl-D-erythritol kinase
LASTIKLKAHAKINLTIEILGKRQDGYHEIVSILQTVGLHDTIKLTTANDISLKTNMPIVPEFGNLAVKAAQLMAEQSQKHQGVIIQLDKSIPISAGLGGGSADAAAVLSGLNRLWELEMSYEDLIRIAVKLGSDVPFFIKGGTAMVSGHGDQVRALQPAHSTWFILICPNIHITNKTKTMYSMIQPSHYTKGFLTRKLEARIRGGGDVPSELLFNTFDQIARKAYPNLHKYWDALIQLGVTEIHLAGSGPSIYAPIPNKEYGTAIKLLLNRMPDWNAHLVPTVQPQIIL